MRHSPRGLVQALVLVLVLSIAGCTPGQESGAVTIGVRTSNCQTPFYVADRQGLYEERGVEVTVQLVPTNTEIIEAMKRGDFQMGSLPVTTAIAAIANGAPLHIVAVTGRGSDGILVRKGDGITGVPDLRGKKVATIRASILDVLLRNTLEQADIDPERDLELLYFGKLGDMISALKTGQVDATSNTEPFMTDAERQGWAQILTYYTADWPDHPCCVIVASDAFLRRRPKAVRAILSVHREAVGWANDNLGEAAQILVDTLGAFDQELVESTFSPSKMRLDYLVRSGEVERMAALMVRYGLIDEVPHTDDLLNLKPLEEALEGR